MVKNGLVLPVHDIEMIKFNFQGENSALLKSYCLIRQTLIQETNFFKELQLLFICQCCNSRYINIPNQVYCLNNLMIENVYR